MRALLPLLAALACAACASTSTIDEPLPMAARMHPDDYVIVTVRNDRERGVPRAGSTPRGYDGSARYTIGVEARSASAALARQYGLQEVSGWPIAELGVHCVVFRIPAGESARQLLAKLNGLFAKYGVGRGLYTGDTTIGLKGRIIFEAPGLAVLLAGHRALEEAVLTKHQNRFKPEVARKWVELVYEGFYNDPLKTDLEAFLASSQATVNGEVVLETQGGTVGAVAIRSPHLLNAKGATYAQSADWGVAEAEGFIRLYGMSSTLWAEVNRKP